MSGGRFGYKQYNITEIAESIQGYLDRQGTPKSKEDFWMQKEYYDEYPEEKFYLTYPDPIQQEMKTAIIYLKIAAVYAHCVDLYLSGDYGDESILSRLEEGLHKLISEEL